MSSHSAKRQQLVWVLAGIFVLLVGSIVWMETDHTPKATQNLSSLDNIIIKRAGHEDIELVRNTDDNAQWHMSKPHALTANSQRIEPLLTLGAAKLDGYETSDVDMQATGLDNPGASFTIGDRTFLLGQTDIDGERRYALVDNQVTLLPEWVWSLIHGGVTAFADLNVFNSLPDTLYVVGDSHTSSISQMENWRSLQADKIVVWPSEPKPVNVTRWVLSSSQDTSDDHKIAELIQFEEHTLIQTKPGFAYAISNSRFDALLSD